MTQKQLTLLIVILNDLNHLPPLLEAWKKVGIPGVTIMPSMGGYQAQNHLKRGGLGNLLGIVDQVTADQRTLYSLFDDPHLLELAIPDADRVVKGFDSPNSGIMFTLPVTQALGLQKWMPSQSDDIPKKKKEEKSQDKGHDNLLEWLEEEIEARYGKDTLEIWKKKKKTRISMVLNKTRPQPEHVFHDDSLDRVLSSLKNSKDCSFVGVVNKEQRLMGTINSHQLADILFIAVIPEAFVDKPETFETAMKYADSSNLPLAGEIMSEAVYILLEDTISEAYIKLRDRRLTEAPVVDNNYRIKGSITLLDLLESCFLEEKSP